MSLIIFGKWRTLTLFNTAYTLANQNQKCSKKIIKFLGWKKKGRENLDDDDVCIMKQTVKWSLTITTFWKSDPWNHRKRRPFVAKRYLTQIERRGKKNKLHYFWHHTTEFAIYLSNKQRPANPFQRKHFCARPSRGLDINSYFGFGRKEIWKTVYPC